MTAWWVYCVMRAGDLPSGLHGVAPVEAVVEGSFGALVSEVPLPEYGDERLRQQLEDLEWVERTARAHQGVLEEAMARGPIVPVRMCTIYRSRSRVEELMRVEADRLGRALTAVDGRSEWGLKVFASVASESPVTVPAGGAAYLEGKLRARAASADRERAVVSAARAGHERLEGLAVAARVNPPQRREAHGRDADMVLNGVYLVDDARREDLGAAVSALQDEHGEVMFELTGPWPPYNFVEGLS